MRVTRAKKVTRRPQPPVVIADSLEEVYGVCEPIPELGALPGDEIIVRRSDPDFPVDLRRTYTLDALRYMRPNAVRMLDASSPAEPTSDGPTPPAPPAPGRRRGDSSRSALRLVG